jgi:sugar/nucleoside kinase (ribokinase family)
MSIINTGKIRKSLEDSNAKITMLADGFVDEVWEIVDARTSPKDYTLYEEMGQFAHRILKAGSGGLGLELIKKRRTFGGFAANIGYAAARLGVDTTLMGVFGKDATDPSFVEVGELCHLVSLDDPAVTQVFEFGDGKLLMTNLGPILELDWKTIEETVGLEKIKSLLSQSDIIGVGYWSLMPYFDEIVEKVCEHLPEDGKQRRLFFDLADLHKKSVDSLKTSLALLKTLGKKAPMTLSLNEHEAAAIFGLYDETLDDVGESLPTKLEKVRKYLGIDELVVHDPNYGAAACEGEEPAFVKASFCTNVVRSAGAGDNFNGGYMAAKLAGLNIVERLHVANATVGHFIRTGEFPTVEKMATRLGSLEE